MPAESVSAAIPRRHPASPSEVGNFRLPETYGGVGALDDGHRAGWPFVVGALADRQGPSGILLDEFVENTFHPGRVRPYWLRPAAYALKRVLGRPVRAAPPWREPWLGVFHLPPRFPEWFDPLVNPRLVFQEPNFRKSLPLLRGAVAFTEYHASWLREQLGVPVLAVKHPTDRTPTTFRWASFANNPEPKLVQVGWYLRNYRAIYQVPVPDHLQKVHLRIRQHFVARSHRRTDRAAPTRHRPDVGAVRVVSWLPNQDYDRLLSENVMFLELFDASANNAVVEAIVRTTPLVVNRHPAVVEYLGEDYPLFYDNLEQAPTLLTDERICAAHDYLCRLDKTDFQIDHFVDAVDEFAAMAMERESV